MSKKKSNKFKTFVSDGLSINEAKTSILIIFFIITIIFALSMYYIDRTIGNNLTSIIGWLIASISGVNIANSVLDGIRIKNDDDDSEDNKNDNNINTEIDLNKIFNDYEYDNKDETITTL